MARTFLYTKAFPILLILTLLLHVSPLFADISIDQRIPVSTELIVTFENGVIPPKISSEHKQELVQSILSENADVTIQKNSLVDNVSVVSTNTSDIDKTIQDLETLPEVKNAEINYPRTLDVISTNDTLRGSQWSLYNSGQTINNRIGTIDADINAPEAWGHVATTSEVIVAVIDTGVDYTHPDIASRMWDGSSCKNGNNIPITGGCIHGYDFKDGDNNPMPLSTETTPEHGTHVAGIIGAEQNNARGIAGVAPNVKIMALKFNLDVASEIEAIKFALANGAKIINASYSGVNYSASEYAAIKEFTDAGGIFITAAGNNNTSNETSHHYPSDYDLPGIISVASTNNVDGLSYFSSFGATSVDLGAPGEDITSLVLGGNYASFSGTSMSAPHVVGVAGLLWGYNPTITSAQVKQIILDSGDTLSGLSGKTVSGKRLNELNAVSTFAPHVGLQGSDVLSSVDWNDRNDGSSIIDIPFIIKDGISGVTAYFTTFEFSINNGASWNSLLNLASTTALTNWNSSFITNTSFASTSLQTFSFNTNHTDVTSVATTTSSTTAWRIRFKANDGATTSPFVYSDSFVFDRTAPVATIATSIGTSTTATTSSFIIGGVDVTHYKYKLGTNAWSIETPVDTPVSLTQLSLGPQTLSVIGRDRSHNWQVASTSSNFSWSIIEPVIVPIAQVPVVPIQVVPEVPQLYGSGGGGGGGGGGSSYTSVTKTVVIAENNPPPIETSIPVKIVTPSANWMALPNNVSVATPIVPIKPTQTFVIGSRGNDVSDLQQKLKSLGIYKGAITGYFGQRTQIALKKYEASTNKQKPLLVSNKPRL